MRSTRYKYGLVFFRKAFTLLSGHIILNEA